MRAWLGFVPDTFFRTPFSALHYQEAVLPIRDGVTNLKDLPQVMGGSGVALGE